MPEEYSAEELEEMEQDWRSLEAIREAQRQERIAQEVAQFGPGGEL